MLYNVLLLGKKTPKIAPSPWDYVTPPEEDRATAIGNVRKKFGKNRTCSLADMLTDRQIYGHTNRRAVITVLRHHVISNKQEN